VCESQLPEKRIIVHLAYMDDAGTDKHSPVVMVGAVIVMADKFGSLEVMHSNAIQKLFAVEEIEEKFKEFHASELYDGSGPFDGIDEKKRYDAIETLLASFAMGNLSYVYAAVDRKKLLQSALGSSNPVDVAFRMCLLGSEDWARAQHSNFPGHISVDFKDMCLFLMDDTDDKALKQQLRRSYRNLRVSRPYIPPHENRLWHAHDDLYFGDSRDSVGIQMADTCNYFMWRQLLKKDDGEGFYRLFANNAQCAKPKPEWDKLRDLFWTHDENPVGV
jgi:hypothetical protein